MLGVDACLYRTSFSLTAELKKYRDRLPFMPFVSDSWANPYMQYIRLRLGFREEEAGYKLQVLVLLSRDQRRLGSASIGDLCVKADRIVGSIEKQNVSKRSVDRKRTV